MIDQETPLPITTTHDSLMKLLGQEMVDQILKGRPYLLLLAGDEIAEHTTRYYACMRGRKLHAIKDVVANGLVALSHLPYNSEKDGQHAISAQNVANRMVLWRKANTPHAPTNARSVDLDFTLPEEPQE